MNHNREAVCEDDDDGSWSDMTEDISVLTPGTPFSPVHFQKSRPRAVTDVVDNFQQNQHPTPISMADSAPSKYMLSTIQQPLPPPIPPPQEEQNKTNDDGKILALSRQRQSSNHKLTGPKGPPVTFRPPENYQSSRRLQLNTIENKLDNRDGTSEGLDVRYYDADGNRRGPYGNSTHSNDQCPDDDTLDSNNMGYLPSRHFQTSAAVQSSALQLSFYAPAGDSIRRTSYLRGQEQQQQLQRHDRSKRSEIQSPSHESHYNQDSVSMFSSNRSIASIRSHRSGPYHQSSDNSSALHREFTEIKDLEGNVIVAEATYRRQHPYQHGEGGYHIGNRDCNSQQDEPNLPEIHIGGTSPSRFGVRQSGGHSILSSLGIVHFNQEQYEGIGDGAPFTFNAASDHLYNVRQHASKLGQDAKQGAVTIMEQASVAVKQILNSYYRPPLSPRSKELNDLEFLKKRHRQKFEEYKIANGEVENDNDETFFDFVIVLKSEEAYKYWAEQLDFRGEYGGPDSKDVLENAIESPGGVSTTSSDSSTSDEEESSDEKNKVDFDQIPVSPESDDYGNVSTPHTGLLRQRRAKTTPPSIKKARLSFLRTPSRNFDSHQKSRMSQSSRSTFSQFTGTPLRNLPSRMSIFEQMIQSPTMTSGRSRTLSQHSYYSRSNHSSSDRNEPGTTAETPMRSQEHRRRWGAAANLQSQLTKAVANTPPVRRLNHRSLSEGIREIPNSNRWNLLRNQQKYNSNKSNLKDDTNDSNGDEEKGIISQRDCDIPQGFTKRKELERFLEALKEGIFLRRHRPNKKAAFCKMFSTDGGDTIRYKFIDSIEAIIAFKEQHVRYSSDTTSPDWSRDGGPSDESSAQNYREKSLCAADIVLVHPAGKKDLDHPGEFGTASLRQSRSDYDEKLSFSLKIHSKKAKTWKKRKGSELLFKSLDFEAATSGEHKLIFRGLLQYYRLAENRNVGIAGGARTTTHDSDDSKKNIKDRLTQDKFIEPTPVGWLERRVVKMLKANDDYIRGAVMPGAIPPVSDYFLGFKSPGTTIWSRLRLAGLETQRVYSVDTRRVMIKIRCPDYRLTDVAEVLRLRMEKNDGSFGPFRESAARIFKQREDHLDVPSMYRGRMASLLRSKDRQLIIDFIVGSRIRDSGAQLARTGNIETIVEEPKDDSPKKYTSWNSYYQFINDVLARWRKRDSGAEHIRTSDIGIAIDARIPLHMPDKLDSLCNSWVFYWRKERWIGNIASEPTTSEESQHLSMEEGNSPSIGKDNDGERPKDSRPVPNFLTRFFIEAFNQPLDSIEDYFGEQVTFYFAWAQHCSIHLLFLAFFGLIVTFCEMSVYNLDHPIRPWFSMAVMIWTFTVLVNWRKRSNSLAYRWGSMDHKEQETNRPEFQGEFVRDPKTNEYIVDQITNEYIIKYPRWKRWLKYMISIPISAFFTGLALFLILMVHANRDTQMANYIEQRSTNSTSDVEFTFSVRNIGKKQYVGDVELNRDLLLDPTYWIIMITLPSLLGLCIPILNIILMRISVMLNDFENYQTDAQYRTHLIIKVFSFRFVSQFGTVYYYAFMSVDPENSAKAVENGMIRMATSLCIYTTVAHWWNIILQVYIFMGIQHIRRYLYNKGLQRELSKLERDEADHAANERCDADVQQIKLENRRILLQQSLDDHWMEIMKAPHDSFPEYITAVVQFTFVACFSVILPCIPFLVLVNYLLSMRFDAYKVCRGRRRPFAKQTGGIGVWEHLLNIVAVIAVLTNCWLVAITNHEFRMMGEQIGSTGTIFLVVAWEHVMLLIKYLMGTTISKLPKEIRDQIRAKQHDFEKKIYEDMRLKTERTRRFKREKSSVASFLSQQGTPDSLSHIENSPFHLQNKGLNDSLPSLRPQSGTPDSMLHASGSLSNECESKNLNGSIRGLHTTTPEKTNRLQTIESFDESSDELHIAGSSGSSESCQSTTPENMRSRQTIESSDERSAANIRSGGLCESTTPKNKSPLQTIESFDEIAYSRPGELFEC